ncbi:Histidinol-phosphatase [Lactococcus lactis]|nr:Histidinol-phosphatase [Lactococcus lactis]
MDFSLNVAKYFQEINQLQAEFKDKIKIKIGLEMGIDLRFKSEINQFIDSAPFDFVIASVHEIGDIEVYDGTEFYLQKTKEEAQREYLLACLDVVQNFENYNSFGHLDYVARYGPYTDKSIKFVDFEVILLEILRNLASKGKSLEVNTRLFDDPKTEQFYSDLLINFKRLGGKFITLGTDSHIAKRDWAAIHKAREIIKKAGFHELATFSKMKVK